MADNSTPDQPLQPLGQAPPTRLPQLQNMTHQGYSTNPSTIKSRRRKLGLKGAKKHEDAARTADYKAMIYARNIIQKKPEFLAASGQEQTQMLEAVMRETMEKRVAKGQDTKSKMAAWNAGQRPHAGITGPQTRVPISNFLVSNGYVPPSASRATARQPRGAPAGHNIPNSHLSPVQAKPYLSNGSPSGSAPLANMNGGGINRHGTAPVFSASGLPVNSGLSRRSSNVFMSSEPPTPSNQVKTPDTPAPFANMTPEPGMTNTIEHDDNEKANGQAAALRNEVAQLRNLCESVLSGNNSIRDHDLHNVRAGFGADKNRVTGLDQRLTYLESVVHAIQSVAIPDMGARISDLERVVDQLRAKVGEGCETEVAKMREVFGSLREALAKVGNFL